MVGPFIEDGSYKLVKLIETQMRPDSVKARHILVAKKVSGDTTHITKTDSIMDVLDKGTDFAFLATTLSDDPGSKEEGGELGWFAEGTMVKAFNDSCFSGSVGDIMLVETQFGNHIIEILEMTEPIKKVKIATIDRIIEPSSKTYAMIYAKANKFAGSNNSVESFESSATELGKVFREVPDLVEGEKTIVGLESPREVVRWAYKVEPGTVSGPFELGNKFVVAVLTSIKDKGYATLEDIRTETEIDARKEKKANYVKAKIAENDDQNVDDLAFNLSANNKEFNLQVETAQNITFSSFNLAGIGREPSLIGHIYGSKKGVMSLPFKGNTGVFVFVIEDYTAAPAVEDLTAGQSRLGGTVQARVEYEVFNALKKNANIVDNRFKFY
jgi:peptidyl-prolyl cis-trans isomerase D